MFRVSKIIILLYKKLQFLKFLYKNGNFGNFLKTKSDQNIHQNAPNCTILKKISPGRHAPEPPSKAHGESRHANF